MTTTPKYDKLSKIKLSKSLFVVKFEWNLV